MLLSLLTKEDKSYFLDLLRQLLLIDGEQNEIEKQILNGAYPTWGESYPKQLPNGFENIGAMNINNTLPNPNAIENKIQELNKIGENE